MNALACAAFSLAMAALPARAGDIAGRVTAHGKEVPGGSSGGAYQSKKYKFLEKINYDEVGDFIVNVEGPAPKNLHAPDEPVSVVVQENAMFSPHVLPIMAGTTVEWPNEDDIFHNVFSMSEGNEFDLQLYKAPDVKRVPFKNPGQVDVFCSIHKNMHCIILIFENPWFAAADKDGRYVIKDVPAGTYKVRAWQERMPAQALTVTVPEQGTVQLDFELGITGLPKY